MSGTGSGAGGGRGTYKGYTDYYIRSGHVRETIRLSPAVLVKFVIHTDMHAYMACRRGPVLSFGCEEVKIFGWLAGTAAVVSVETVFAGARWFGIVCRVSARTDVLFLSPGLFPNHCTPPPRPPVPRTTASSRGAGALLSSPRASFFRIELGCFP